jgi:steroid delta-isomerase-like uncharacterized protein
MTQQQVAGGPLDRAWADEFEARWGDAWNSQDADAVLALMTEDIVYDDSAWPRQMRGHDDVREFLAHTWRALPDLRFETLKTYLHPDRPEAAYYWRGEGTNTGPLDPPGLRPTGKVVRFDGADFREYRDGKVAGLRIAFDMADIMRQVGVLPPTDSREERVLAKVSNLRNRLPGG